MFENAIAIAIGDAHLDEHAWADRSDIRDDSRCALQFVVDLAVANNLPLILAGDTLDKRVNNAMVARFLARQIAKTPATFFVQGQHDLQPDPWMHLANLDDEFSRAVWLDDEEGLGGGEYASMPGVKIWGIDWTPADRLQEKLDRIPADTDLLVMHQVCQELMGNITLPEVSAKMIPYAKLVIIGDYHPHKIVKAIGASGQQLTMLSPGSTNMRSIDEPADKYAWIIKKDLTFEPVRIPTRPKWATMIADEEMLNEFVTTIGTTLEQVTVRAIHGGTPAQIARPLVRIHFDPSIPLAYQRIKDAVSGHGHLFTAHINDVVPPQSLDETVETSDAELELQEQLDDLSVVSCLPLAVRSDEEPEVFELCRRLLTESDPVAVLTEVRKDYIGDTEVTVEA